MRRLFSIALLGLVASGVASSAAAATARDGLPTLRAPFDLVADEVEYERERDLYVARGDVRIVQGDRTLTADWVSLSNATGIGVASGDVVIREGADTLYAEFLQFDVETLQGVLYEGRLDSAESRFRLEGREVRRTGERSYAFQRARFTTCRCPEPGRDPWSIQAESADLEVEGYGTVRNSTFEILGVPVLWVPWITVPLKTERSSGLLLPEVGGASRRGADVGLPLFWAASDALNVTFTPSWISKRGFEPRLELEYVLGEHSGGEAFGSFISDGEIDEDDPSTPFPRQRWAAAWRHDHFLPGDWRFKVDARAVSDNLHPFDFEELSRHRADRFLESSAFVGGTLAGERLGLVAALGTADDLQAPDDLDRDDFLLQRVPHVELAALPGTLPGIPHLVASLDVDYTNFRAADRASSDLPGASVVGPDLFLDTGIDARPNGEERDASGAFVAGDGSLDDFPFGPENDGRFQEGEPLADAGHRVVVAPSLALPLRLGDLLELYPEVGYHGTFYQTRAQGFESRSLLTGRLDLRGRLRRDFELPFGAGPAVHLLEPRVGWALVSGSSQARNPLFVPPTARPQDRVRELELANVTRDPADRIERFHGVVLGLGNRFFGAGPEAGRLWADVSLSGQYDFAESEFGLVVLEGRGAPRRDLELRFHAGYDPEERRLAEGLFELGWVHEAGHELGVAYRYLREIPLFFEAYRFDDERFDDFEADFDRVDQLAVAARAALGSSWALTYRAAYSFQSSLALVHEGGIEYVSRCRCWAIRLEVEDDRSRGVGFGIRYRLIGLGDDAARPFGRTRAGGGFLDVFSGL